MVFLGMQRAIGARSGNGLASLASRPGDYPVVSNKNVVGERKVITSYPVLQLATDAALAAEAERDALQAMSEASDTATEAEDEDESEAPTAAPSVPQTAVEVSSEAESGEDASEAGKAAKRAYGARKRGALALNLKPDAAGEASTEVGIAFTRFSRGEAVALPHSIGEYPAGTLVQHAERYGAKFAVEPAARLVGKATESGEAPTTARATSSRTPGTVTTSHGSLASREALDRIRDGIRTSLSGEDGQPGIVSALDAAKVVLGDAASKPQTVRDALKALVGIVSDAAADLEETADKLNVLSNPHRAKLAEYKLAFITALKARSAADALKAEALVLEDAAALRDAEAAIDEARGAYVEAERLYNLARA
jgi:hypothetical protein